MKVILLSLYLIFTSNFCYAEDDTIINTFTSSATNSDNEYGELKRFTMVAKDEGEAGKRDPSIVFGLEGSASTDCGDNTNGKKMIGMRYEKIESKSSSNNKTKSSKKYYVIRPMTFNQSENGIGISDNIYCVKAHFDKYFKTKLAIKIHKGTEVLGDRIYIYEFPMRNLYSIYLKVKYSKDSVWSWEVDDSGYYDSVMLTKKEYIDASGGPAEWWH